MIPLGLAPRGFFLGVVDRNSSAFLQQPETVMDASFTQQLQHLALHSGPLMLTKFIGIGVCARCTEIVVIHERLGEIQRVH